MAHQNHDFVLQHSESLRRLARALLKDADAAEDVVQETWLIALKRPPLADRPLRPWLLRVARNLAVDSLRRSERRRKNESHAAREDSEERDENEAALEAATAVGAALGQLQDPYRTVVVLHFYDELSLDEISRRLQRPLETTRTQLKRGLAQLRELLGRRQGGERASGWLATLAAPRPTLAPRRGRLEFVAAALVVCTIGALLWRLQSPTEDAPSTVTVARSPVEAREPTRASDAIERRALGETATRRTVQVLRREDRAPVVGARVRVEGEGTSEGITDASGHVEIAIAPADAQELHLSVDRTLDSFDERARIPTQRWLDSSAEIVLEVTGAVHVRGVVVDDAGRPAAGAVVRAFTASYPENATERAVEAACATTSDADGHFEIGGLPRRFFLRTTSGASLVGDILLFERADASLVDGASIALMPTRTVTGVVRTASGSAAAGVLIRTIPSGDGLAEASPTNLEGVTRFAALDSRATTDSSGRFALAGLPLGPAVVLIQPCDAPSMRRPIEVGVSTIDFGLEPGTQLRVVVQDSGAHPVQGASVTLGGAPDSPRAGRTDADGVCVLAGLKNLVRAFVRVDAPGLGSAFIAVPPASNGDVLRIVLSRPHSLAGVVRDENGRLVVGARVTASIADLLSTNPVPGQIVSESWRSVAQAFDVATTTTDANGRFLLTSLPDHPLEILVELPGSGASEIFTAKASDVNLECAFGAERAGYRTITGTVVDAVTKRPIAPGGSPIVRIVEIGGDTRTVRAIPDTNGHFHVVVPENTRWSFVVRAAGYATLVENLLDDPSDVTLELCPSARIELAIVDRRGTPVEGGFVLVEDEDGVDLALEISALTMRSLVRVDARGLARLVGVPSGNIRLTYVPRDLRRIESCVLHVGGSDASSRLWTLDSLDLTEPRTDVDLHVLDAGLANQEGGYRVRVFTADGRAVIEWTMNGTSARALLEPDLTYVTRIFDDDETLATSRVRSIGVQSWSSTERAGVAEVGLVHTRVPMPLGIVRIVVDGVGLAPVETTIDTREVREAELTLHRADESSPR